MNMIIAVDLGATNLRVALVNEKRILKKIKVKTEKSSKLAVPKQIVKIAEKFKKDAEAIVIASAGLIDLKRGEVKPPNLPFKKIPLVKFISETLKLPVYLINDGNASVVGEKFYGSGKMCENLAYITLSSGIGCGVIVNNNLLLGKDGNAAELGHIVIDKEGKLKCGCGKRGHWEAYCSGTNIHNFLKLWLKEKKKTKGLKKYSDVYKIFDEAKKGDKIILEFLEEVGKLNSIGFANLINAFNPELITVGGGMVLNNKKLILNPIKKYLKDYVFNRIPKIKITKLGDDIAIYGCMGYFYKILKR